MRACLRRRITNDTIATVATTTIAQIVIGRASHRPAARLPRGGAITRSTGAVPTGADALASGAEGAACIRSP